MKRAICLFLILLMLGGIFVAPTGYDITDEMIEQFGETQPDNTLHYPDYVPSAEGDISSESITSFSETLDDDVLFYPDRDGFLYDYAVNGGGANYIAWLSGTIADTQTLNDGNHLRFYEASASPIDDFIILNISYMSQEFLCLNASSRVGTNSYDTYWYLYNYTSSSYVLVYTQPTSDSAFYWYNWTISNDYTDGMSIKVKIEHYDIEFGETWDVQIEYISSHYPATQGHAESFTDITDWTNYGISAEDSVSTDGDVLIIEAYGNTNDDYDGIVQDLGMTDTEGLYYEIRFRQNLTYQQYDLTYLSIYDTTGATQGSENIRLEAIMGLSDSSTFYTYKGIWPYDDIDNVYIRPRVDTGEQLKFEVDYFRFGPSTEMGWQHDCSTTAGTDNDGCTVTSDGDKINATASGASKYVTFKTDTTATWATTENNYYPFLEWVISDSSTTVTPRVVGSTGSRYLSVQSAGTYRYNIKADTLGDFKEMRFYILDGEWAQFDWIQAYSIANYTYADTSSAEVEDVLYVEDGILKSYIEGWEGLRLTTDWTLSVDVSVYNVWNITSSDSDHIRYNFYVGGGWCGYSNLGETRGDFSRSGSLTKFETLFYTTDQISAIKFWEDAVAPTINNVWATPYSPTEIDDVTLSVYTADWTDLYEVTLNAIDYPATFNDVDYSCSKNSEDTDLWTYTFDEADMPAGYYAFQAIANDGANTNMELVIFRVVTVYLQVTDIVLITATETIAQLSGYINKDANYVIYENNSDSGSGAVSDGWFSISWAKDTTAGAYIELGIKFTSGAYTEWVNGSYSVATATVLYITDTVYSTTGTRNYLSGYANLEVTTWTAYNNNTQMATGSLTAGSFQVDWAKNTTVGIYEWGVSFTDGTTTRWVNGSFSIDAATVLLITDTIYSTSGDYLYLSGYTNLGCDWYAYNNDTQMASGAITTGSFETNWAKNTTTGFYEWGVKFTDGTTTRWINGSFEIAADALLFIQDIVYSATEDRNYLGGHATLEVTTWIAYNNNTQMATGSLTAGSFQVDWAKNTTVGIYEWGVSFTDGTTTRWVNGTFEVDVVEIAITIYTFFGASSDFTYMQFSGRINYDCTYNISEWSNSYALNETHTGSVSEGMFNIAWDKIGVNDADANFTIVFVSGSLSLTIEGYYGTAYKLLRIVEIDVDNTEESQALTNITVNFYTNKDVDWFVYDRDDNDAVLVCGSSVEGSDYLTWAKNRIEHAHYYAVKWTDGVTNIWYNSSYWTFKENIDSLDQAPIDWDARDARRTIEFWVTVGAIIGVVTIVVLGLMVSGLKDDIKKLQLPHYDTQDDEET